MWDAKGTGGASFLSGPSIGGYSSREDYSLELAPHMIAIGHGVILVIPELSDENA